MRPVSGKRVVWIVFGSLAVLTGLAVYWFVQHAEALRRGAPAENAAPAER